jgi:hypothetical protein
MIDNWLKFNESFTRVIKSVYDFINTIGDIDKKDFFIEELNSFCIYNDIPLSKLTGKYLSRTKTIKEINFKYENETNCKMGIFLFKLDGFLSQINIDSSSRYSSLTIDQIIDSDFDFAVVIDINEQEKGLGEIIRKRSLRKDGLVPLKSDDFNRSINIQRYKEILRKKRSPRFIENIIVYIIKNYSIDNISKAIDDLKGRIPDDLYEDLVNKLYDYNLLSLNDYYYLSSNSKYNYY